jgi:hypothetical protein
MRKTIYILSILYAISLIYAISQFLILGNSFSLSFLNATGFFSLALLIFLILLLLSSSGYFDVFGYTFKKTYLMFSNKYNKLDQENQEKYKSYYDYSQYKVENRLIFRQSFILSIATFIIINVILNVLYLIVID